MFSLSYYSNSIDDLISWHILEYFVTLIKKQTLNIIVKFFTVRAFVFRGNHANWLFYFSLASSSKRTFYLSSIDFAVSRQRLSDSCITRAKISKYCPKIIKKLFFFILNRHVKFAFSTPIQVTLWLKIGKNMLKLNRNQLF